MRRGKENRRGEKRGIEETGGQDRRRERRGEGRGER